MLSLSNNITGKSFVGYVSACFCYADVFSLTQNGWKNTQKKDEPDQILQLLAPYHIRTLHTNCWFCHRVPNGYDIEVYLFNAVRQTRDIILEKYSSLFYNNSVWDKPEDLCFFQNGILISGSVSHENICFAYEQENSFLKDIKLYGIWENIPAIAEEQIRINTD